MPHYNNPEILNASFYQVKPDKTWIAGIIAVILSYLLFVSTPAISPDLMEGQFFLNYVIAVAYLFVLIFQGRLRRGRQGLSPLFVLLVLSLISAYALNRGMNIFDQSTTWWAGFLALACINYLSLPFFPRLPAGFQQMICLIAGLALPAFIYLAIYLAPMYPLSALASFFLGISLHSFVPLLFVLYTIVFMRKVSGENRRLWIGFGTGIGLAILASSIFIIKWRLTVNELNRNYETYSSTGRTGLPAWAYAAENSSRGPVMEKVLKADLVYATYDDHWGFFNWKPGSLFYEQRKHDPLVVLATLFCGQSSLDEQDRIKVLESIYDSRHNAQQRLRRGDDLTTSRVGTSVEIWPWLHLGYTEKDITVKNNSAPGNWRNQQEAFYTFHLPEGAVVSSLSLWIDGKEEKALLTSRKKADSAYQTIVGKERRDPAVIHWQEGNRVTVRVFPVPAGESRHFRIGITAPLEKSENELIYHNAWFDGPSPAAAEETVTIRPAQALQRLRLPSFFPGGGYKEIKREGIYQADWELGFQDEGVRASDFGFNGDRYLLMPYEPEDEATDFQDVYLDINKGWSRRDLETIWPWLQGKRIFAYDAMTGLIPVTEKNKDEIFSANSRLEFSLFPLTAIKAPSSSLLISKSTEVSPEVSDLQGTTFSGDLQKYFSGTDRVCLFNLGHECSPYLKALKECGAFRYETGDAERLHTCLKLGKFAKQPDRDGSVVIGCAGIMIQKSQAIANSSPTPPNQAPDHMMRLFSYRRIMQQMEGRMPGEGSQDPQVNVTPLVDVAQAANIVTPVSSLVVLETAEDYKRFDIQASRNRLKNAEMANKGSVPEPGEWALLALVVALFLFIRYSRR